MTRRKRTLKPHERARQDQASAAARNLGATDPHTVVLTMTHAEPGAQCSWCDCPDDPTSPHYQPGHVCDGCPEDAAYTLHRMHGTPEQLDFPVCERHQQNLIDTTVAWSQHMFGTSVGHVVHRYSVSDDGRPDLP